MTHQMYHQLTLVRNQNIVYQVCAQINEVRQEEWLSSIHPQEHGIHNRIFSGLLLLKQNLTKLFISSWRSGGARAPRCPSQSTACVRMYGGSLGAMDHTVVVAVTSAFQAGKVKHLRFQLKGNETWGRVKGQRD